MTWPGDYSALAIIITSTIVILGAFWKFIILPQIRLEVVKPVQETHQQVTENGGRNDPPTLPDKLHTIQESVDDLHATVGTLDERDERHAASMALMQANLSAIVLVLDEHLRWSRDYVAHSENGKSTEEGEQ